MCVHIDTYTYIMQHHNIMCVYTYVYIYILTSGSDLTSAGMPNKSSRACTFACLWVYFYVYIYVYIIYIYGCLINPVGPARLHVCKYICMFIYIYIFIFISKRASPWMPNTSIHVREYAVTWWCAFINVFAGKDPGTPWSYTHTYIHAYISESTFSILCPFGCLSDAR